MGFFDLFKSKKFNDDVFGELSYTTFKNPLSNFYEGSVDFHGKKMGLIIEADENGPTQLQKDFFFKFRDNYQAIQSDIIIPFLKKDFEENFDEEYQITDFEKEFEFDAITIPRLPKTPVEWSICYDSSKFKHWVTINFSDYQPLSVIVDG